MLKGPSIYITKKKQLQIEHNMLKFQLIFIADYALNFPTKGVSDHVNIWGMPSLTQWTVCLWMKSSDTTNYGTPFSYAVPGGDNEIIFYNYKAFTLYINQQAR